MNTLSPTEQDGPILRTERLVLRRWQESDLLPFATLNADPRVMEFFPGPMTREESDAMARRLDDSFDRRGFGFWVVEVPDVTPFVGFVGLAVPSFEAAFTPCVEVGWRLASDHWGQGYATEAARAALDFGFDAIGLDEVVSFTVPENLKSRKVMERLGLKRDPSRDFDHPFFPGHHLERHVLYGIRSAEWRAIRSS